MTIQQVIKSGKRFRRKSDRYQRWISVDDGHFVGHDEAGCRYPSGFFMSFAILADDWEIEEERALISRTQIQEFLQEVCKRQKIAKEQNSNFLYIEDLFNKLGFTQ
jgi:hypothetical protein